MQTRTIERLQEYLRKQVERSRHSSKDMMEFDMPITKSDFIDILWDMLNIIHEDSDAA